MSNISKIDLFSILSIVSNNVGNTKDPAMWQTLENEMISFNLILFFCFWSVVCNNVGEIQHCDEQLKLGPFSMFLPSDEQN